MALSLRQLLDDPKGGQGGTRLLFIVLACLGLAAMIANGGRMLAVDGPNRWWGLAPMVLGLIGTFRFTRFLGSRHAR